MTNTNTAITNAATADAATTNTTTTTINMTTGEMANRYMELFRQGKASEIQDTLYDDNVVCKEPEHASALGIPTLTQGLVAVKAKTKARQETIAQVQGVYCTEPAIGGGYFSMAMGREITFKNGKKLKADEIAVFGVKDGKIVSETFFY